MSLAFASLQGREGRASFYFFLPTLLFPSVGSTDRSGNRSRFHSLWQRLRQQQQQRIGSKEGHPRFLSTNDNGFFCCCGFWALSIFLPLSGAHSDPDILQPRFLQVPRTFFISLRCVIRCTEFLARSFQICRAVCTEIGPECDGARSRNQRIPLTISVFPMQIFISRLPEI